MFSVLSTGDYLFNAICWATFSVARAKKLVVSYIFSTELHFRHQVTLLVLSTSDCSIKSIRPWSIGTRVFSTPSWKVGVELHSDHQAAFSAPSYILVPILSAKYKWLSATKVLSNTKLRIWCWVIFSAPRCISAPTRRRVTLSVLFSVPSYILVSI